MKVADSIGWFILLIIALIIFQIPAFVENFTKSDKSSFHQSPLSNITLNVVFPEVGLDKPLILYDQTITAFNTVPQQTDSSPCIAAGGYICGVSNVVACPRRFKLGTEVVIDGDTYTCLDRLALKYDNRFDISFDKDIEGARKFGIKTLDVIILE